MISFSDTSIKTDIQEVIEDFDPCYGQEVHLLSDAILSDTRLEHYAPVISKETGEWLVSETDLAFIAEGVGVLGTGKIERPFLIASKPTDDFPGGGGSVRSEYLNCVKKLRSVGFGKMRIIDSRSIQPEGQVVSV